MLGGRRSRQELRRMAGRLNTTRAMRRMRSWHWRCEEEQETKVHRCAA